MCYKLFSRKSDTFPRWDSIIYSDTQKKKMNRYTSNVGYTVVSSGAYWFIHSPSFFNASGMILPDSFVASLDIGAFFLQIRSVA